MGGVGGALSGWRRRTEQCRGRVAMWVSCQSGGYYNTHTQAKDLASELFWLPSSATLKLARQIFFHSLFVFKRDFLHVLKVIKGLLAKPHYKGLLKLTS